MLDVHLTASQLEQYVIGALEPAAVVHLERHVESCELCALALRREAALELKLAEVALDTSPAPLARPFPVRLTAAVLGLSMAAAALLAAVLYVPGQSVDGSPRLVRCSDPTSAAACVARADYDGLLSVGPNDEVVVPRYDQLPEATPQRGSP
jgi:hypothetical protein